MNLLRPHSRRASALLAALIVIVLLTFAAAGVLSYSLTSYRNSLRQSLLDQAKEVADSEMEYLFYQWKTQLLTKQVSVANLSCVNPKTGQPNYTSPLVTTGVCAVNMSTPVNTLTPSPTPFSMVNNQAGWQVARTIVFNPIEETSDGAAQGIEPGTQQIGHNYYFSAYTSASINNPVVGTVSFHSGRHFVYSSTSLFQFAVFYQGNIEIAAGGAMTIKGPISTNASAYMGSQAGYALTIADTAYYFQDYNGASDPLSGETQRLEGTGALNDPVYNPDPQSTAPSDQTAQRGLQVVKLNSQSSFIGGVDVANDIATYPTAYMNLQGQPDPNEVYRSVIAPPPTNGNGLIQEDPVVAANRMYNVAALVITINQTAAGLPNDDPTGGNVAVHFGNAANPDAYTAAFKSNITAILPAARTNITDPREYLNGSTGVNLTTLDVNALNTVLTGPGGMLTNPSNPLAQAYNGVVYVYDKTDNTQMGGGAGNLNGIMLQNGDVTPQVNDANGNPQGFTVVSNNGVYVKGNYNTNGGNSLTINGVSGVNNPAAIMGDAVTALSATWNSGVMSLPIDPGRQATQSMTVNAAILTGNTPSTQTTNSGGVQNLVRMVEDWYGNGLSLTLNGSLGQLFTSKYFTGPYLGNAIQSGLPGANNRIYIQPFTRNFDYDAQTFQHFTPAGSPTTTAFARGDFFFW